MIDRIKEALSITADNELSAALNISKSNVVTWRSRGKVPYSVAVNVAIEHQVSLDWLLTGSRSTTA